MLFALLAQVRPSQFPPPNSGGDSGGGILALICPLFFMLLYLAVIVAIVAGTWKIFEKAGKPGWAAIVPIYNMIVLLEITGKPIWWIAIILFVPCVNIVFLVLLFIALAKSFGKSDAYGLGLAFLGFIFVPLLGFSDARYQGPVG